MSNGKFWLIGAIGALGTAGAVAFSLRSNYERKTLTTRFVTVTDKKIDRKLRLVFLSDLHGNSFGKNNRQLIQCIMDARPDAVLMGGDMFNAKEYLPKDFGPLTDILLGLQGKFPVFYAEGNHELRLSAEAEKYPGWNEEFKSLLERYDVKYLEDETVELTEGITLSGLHIDKKYYKKLYFGKLSKNYVKEHLPELKKEKYNIVMAHTPQYMEQYWQGGADLVLSGHFHGGTVVLPLIGPLMSPQLMLHPKYACGASLKGEKKSITSAGLGTHSINIRINNKPEIVIIDLTVGEQNGT